MEKYLKHGKPVIMDRCNVHPKERKMWVTEAKKYTTHVDCLFLNTPIDECKRRAKERKNHPTLDIDKVDEVIDDFARGLQEPKISLKSTGLYCKFCGNIVADEHRSSATMLPQNFQYNLIL
jgi:predicted kinase